MSNSFQFDYNIFYNYYTTYSNLEIDNTEKYTNYYAKTYSKTSKKEKLSKYSIWINNNPVHVTKIVENGKNALLFSLPSEENVTERWDDHFHFGKDDNIIIKNPNTNKKEKITGVYFHKTIQHPEKGGKELISCYFLPNMEINKNMKNFEEMKCLQRGYKMKDLYTENDFIYLNEIIKRPFIHQSPSEHKKISFRDTLLHTKKHHKKNTKHSGKTYRGGIKKKTRKYHKESIII